MASVALVVEMVLASEQTHCTHATAYDHFVWLTTHSASSFRVWGRHLELTAFNADLVILSAGWAQTNRFVRTVIACDDLQATPAVCHGRFGVTATRHSIGLYVLLKTDTTRRLEFLVLFF